MKGLQKSQMARLHKKLQTEENSRTFARLADQLRLTGHVENAIEVLHKGLQFHPNYTSGYVVLGHCHLEMGVVKDAREAFLKALTLDSENLLVLKNLGDILFQQGELEEALKYYHRALELDPRNVDIQQVVNKLETRHQEEMTLAARHQAESESDPEAEADPKEDIPPVAEVPPFGEQIFEAMEPLSAYLNGEGSSDQAADPEAQLSPEETELLREEEQEETGKGPPRGMATATLAEVYFQQGLLSKAIETYKKVLRHRPGDQVIKDRLAELRTLRLAKAKPKKGSRSKSAKSPPPSPEQQTDLESTADTTEEE